MAPANGPALYATASTWTESSLTWSTRPASVGGIVANTGNIADNVWVEYDVTSLITGDGTYSVLLDPESSNGLTADSREGAQPPQLVVNTTSTAATATATSVPPTVTQTSVPPTVTNTPAGVTNTPTSTPMPTSGNTATPTSSPTATLPGSGTRLNAGGPALTTSGVAWASDQFFDSGVAYASTAAIANTTDDALYQTERYASADQGPLNYAIPVANGSYSVRLHFAELYFTAAGKRVFSANLEGGPVELQNFDIYAAIGTNAAVVKEYTVAVSDGTLDIAFTSSVNRAKVNAIEIVPASGSTPTPTATATTTSMPLTTTPTNTPTSTPTTPTTPTPTSGSTPTPTSSPTAMLPPSGTRLKTMTFEDGSLTHPASGADSTVGSVLLETGAPLAGSASATMNNTTSTYLVEEFADADTLYLSFLLRVNAVPSSTTIIAQLRDSSTSYGNLQLTSSGKLRLRNGSTTVGSDSTTLTAGTLYRVGLRQTKQSGSSANGTLQAFVVAGDNAFGSPFAQSGTQSLSAAVTKTWIGSINSSGAARITVDDVALDTAAFAPPATTTPTVTPTATATPPATCNDTFEPNDTRAQAKPIQANEAQQHMLCQSSTGDYDWVSFQGTAGEVYAFQTTKADDCSITTPLYLYKNNETSWIGAVFGDDCTGATLTIRIPENGTYYLRIGSVLNGNGPADVPYTLRVLADPCNDNYEPDESQAQAKTLAVGEIQSHVICLKNDQDWLRLDLIAGWTYTFETFNLSAVADTYLGLYYDGHTLPFKLNDDANENTNAS